MKVVKWLLLGIVLQSPLLGDLDEQGFSSYDEGDLLKQQGWHPQSIGGGDRYADMAGRVLVVSDPETGGHYIEWIAGFSGREQTRIVKNFEPTTSPRVKIEFEFLPGAATVTGQFYFDKKGESALSLRFLKGEIHIMNAVSREMIPTGIQFQPDDWNLITLDLDFESSTIEIHLNGKSEKFEALPVGLFDLNRVNFFAGGVDFSSKLRSLKIQSIQ